MCSIPSRQSLFSRPMILFLRELHTFPFLYLKAMNMPRSPRKNPYPAAPLDVWP